MVSTIIRTYNRGYIIGEALQSALDQQYQDIEIVVVDDGSTDDTRDVVRRFNCEKVRYVRHSHNQGVAVAANTGISVASGELIALLDSDDLWKPDKLARQVSFLYRHPEVDAVFSDVEILDGERRIPSTMKFMRCFPKMLEAHGDFKECVLGRREMYLCLLEEVPVKTNTLMVRRGVFDRVGTFDETSQSGEDWEFLLRLSREASFGYINAALAIQRWSADATHRRYWEQDKLFLLRLFLDEKRRLQEDPEATSAVNRGIASHCGNLAFEYLYSGRRGRALSVYLQGFRETGELGFLLRAAAALMPLRFRDAVRGAVGSARLRRGPTLHDTGVQS